MKWGSAGTAFLLASGLAFNGCNRTKQCSTEYIESLQRQAPATEMVLERYRHAPADTTSPDTTSHAEKQKMLYDFIVAMHVRDLLTRSVQPYFDTLGQGFQRELQQRYGIDETKVNVVFGAYPLYEKYSRGMSLDGQLNIAAKVLAGSLVGHTALPRNELYGITMPGLLELSPTIYYNSFIQYDKVDEVVRHERVHALQLGTRGLLSERCLGSADNCAAAKEATASYLSKQDRLEHHLPTYVNERMINEELANAFGVLITDPNPFNLKMISTYTLPTAMLAARVEEYGEEEAIREFNRIPPCTIR